MDAVEGFVVRGQILLSVMTTLSLKETEKRKEERPSEIKDKQLKAIEQETRHSNRGYSVSPPDKSLLDNRVALGDRAACHTCLQAVVAVLYGRVFVAAIFIAQ